MKKEFTRTTVNTLFLLGIVAVVSAYTAPTVSPPGGNVPAPLNTGSSGQTKVGGLILNTGGAVNGLIVQSGNVGIGTTNPLQKLDVTGNVNVTGCFMINGTCISSGGGGGGVSQIIAGTNVTISPTSGTGAVTINASGGGGGYWGASGSNIYNTNSGNVGVGTANPAEKLAVSGNSYVSGLGKFGDLNAVNNGIGLWGTPQGVLVGANNGLMVGIGQSGSGSVGIGVSNGYTPYGTVGWNSSDGNFWIGAYGRNLVLHTDSGRNVSLDYGNLGIGTAYPSQKLEVAGNIKAGRFYMGDNQYGTNVPGIGTDGTNVGATTYGVFAVTNGGSGYQPVYASDYYIANIGKWASQLGGGGGGQTIKTGVVSLTFYGSQDASAAVSFGTTFTTAPVVLVTTKDRWDFTVGASNVTTTGFTLGSRWVASSFNGTVQYYWTAIGN